MKLMRNLLISTFALLLAGCAGLGPQESVEGPGNAEDWKAHKAHISEIDGWQISGKIGIQAPQDSGSGTLFWLQRQGYFDIRLSGPLGRGATRLTGRPDAVALEVAGQGRFEAESPEALVESKLGWQLPVSHLLYWVRGLPAPDSRSRIALDPNGRLASLQQDGWDVQYLGYTEEDGYTLPNRIKLAGRDLKITLVVKDWQPRQLGH
ncbi:lipoprotein insertase outer membrane protein LolB [Pseudomonas sp. NPDC047963]|jgi:outer membrane lipoprotein LolB|nr:lipoprotein insertase outer membrane protein LolB [Pseudomonas sp.]